MSIAVSDRPPGAHAPGPTVPSAGPPVGEPPAASQAGAELLRGLVAAVLVVAATTSIDKVLLGSSWRPLVWAAVGLSAGTAALARRLRLGMLPTALISFVVWALYTSSTQLPSGPLLPGRPQLRALSALWSRGFADLVQEAAPARPLAGLLLLITITCWVLAHLAHELLVRGRRPGLTILTVAPLWMFPLAVPQPPGRTWPQAVPFLAAAALVLLVEPETDLWAGTPEVGARHPMTILAGTMLGGIAILLAAVLPAALPGYGRDPWVDFKTPGAARGYQPIVDVSRRLHLPAPRDLLRVTTDRPLYLRLAGLDTFDGSTWRLGPPDQPSFSPEKVMAADRTLTPEVEIRERQSVTAAVENLSLENVFVPVPYHPVRVSGQAAHRMVYSQEGTFIATSDVLDDEPALLPGLSYTVESAVPVPSVQQLRSIRRSQYRDPRYQSWMALPATYRQLRQVTDQIVAEAGASTPYDMSLAVQDYFRDTTRFTYSTAVPPLRGGDALTRFVLQDRTGYCEYFATAMAVMLRLEGIPARVAVGFRPGSRVSATDYVVNTDDAHAWVEVLFPGYGWIQFEPTPGLGDALVPNRETAVPQVPLDGKLEPTPPTPSPAQPTPSASPTPQAKQPPQEADGPPPDVPGGAGGRRFPLLPGLLAALLAVGALFVATRARDRAHGDELEQVLSAQRRLTTQAWSYGLRRERSETVADVTGRWVEEGRVDAAQAQRLTRLVQAAAFGGDVEPGEGAEARRLAGQLSSGLRASVPARARLLGPARLGLRSLGSTAAGLSRMRALPRRALARLSGRLSRITRRRGSS